MTGKTATSKYIVPGSHNLQIPAEGEFHRYASNRITISDFDMSHSNELAVNKVAAAIRWTLNNEKKRSKNKNGGVKNA